MTDLTIHTGTTFSGSRTQWVALCGDLVSTSAWWPLGSFLRIAAEKPERVCPACLEAARGRVRV